MPFNVDQFKSNAVLKEGVLRTNQYIMEIPRVPGLWASKAQRPTFQEIATVNDNMQFLCDSTNVPMSGNEIHGVRRYGYGVIERKPVFPTFGNLQCTFLCDNYATVQRFFHEWLKVICNYDFGNSILDITSATGSLIPAFGPVPQVVYELSYKREYSVDITITEYEATGEAVRILLFREAYPVVVPDMRLAWGEKSQMMKVPVVFTFFDWQDFIPEK